MTSAICVVCLQDTRKHRLYIQWVGILSQALIEQQIELMDECMSGQMSESEIDGWVTLGCTNCYMNSDLTDVRTDQNYIGRF